MESIKNRIDFALVFKVRNANPNGDPIDGNRPRTTYGGYGEVSDVCLKRKIRNRLIDAGESIFVQSDDRRNDNFRSLRERANGDPDIAVCMKEGGTREDYAAIACRKWYDVRAFGQVFAFKKTDGKKKSKDGEETADNSADAVSIGVRGPVSIQPAFSIAPVNITSSQITKSVNLETGADPDVKGADTMGTKHRVDFGVYVTFGSIGVQEASRTGFSDKDAEALREALRTLFVNDATAARPSGSMEVVNVIWWSHNCPNGQYSSAKVHGSLHVSCDADGNVTVVTDQLKGLEPQIIQGL